MHKRLFTPGPTEVRPEILKELATPQIYHRAPEFSDLYAEIQPKLQTVLYTKNPVFLFTSSSTGAMESAVTNCVAKKCLVLVNGAVADLSGNLCAGHGPGLVAASGARATARVNRWWTDPVFWVDCGSGARVELGRGETAKAPCAAAR